MTSHEDRDFKYKDNICLSLETGPLISCAQSDRECVCEKENQSKPFWIHINSFVQSIAAVLYISNTTFVQGQAVR